MKRLKIRNVIVALCAMSALFSTQVLAHVHTDLPQAVQPKLSPWAQTEVARAAELGLLPASGLPDDYSAPLTRENFRLLAMQFLAVQNRSDLNSFQNMIAFYLAEKDELGAVKKVFSDGSLEDSYAYYIGLFQGDGTGTCRPGDGITRQEIATMLMRVYSICGGMPTKIEEPTFRDGGDIADWALESVSALAGWSIMKGFDGNFMPHEPCTVEQGILLLTRLYETAPVRLDSGNTKALFTHEQSLAYINSRLSKAEDTAGLRESLRMSGTIATFIRLEMEGVTAGQSYFYMLHKKGGVMQVDLGICNTSYGVANNKLILENPRFSDDGSVFCCTVTLAEDVVSYSGDSTGVVLHEKGVYNIAVDVERPMQGSAERA